MMSRCVRKILLDTLEGFFKSLSCYEEIGILLGLEVDGATPALI